MNSQIGRRIAAAVATSFTLAATAATPSHAAPADTPSTCTPAQRQAAGQAYLDALINHDLAWKVPLAPNVSRIENGIVTASNADQVRLDLWLHIEHSVILGIENKHWQLDPEGRPGAVNVKYDLPVGLAGNKLATAHVDEDFYVPATSCVIEKVIAHVSL